MKDEIRLLKLILAIMALAGTVAAVALLRVGRQAEAERNYGSIQIVILAVTEFVVTNGRWPTGWNDLEAVQLKGFPAIVMSEVIPQLQSDVHVDFSFRVADADNLTPEEFRAIRPNGPCFAYRDHLAPLLDAMRKR